MQLMPATGVKVAQLLGKKDFHENDLFLPEVNIELGSAYLARLNTLFKGNLPIIIAAYNAGPVAVLRWIEQTPNLPWDEFIENIPFEETQTYVKKVLRFMDAYYRLYQGEDARFTWSETTSLPKINSAKLMQTFDVF
jgi:soluble lytic murein transglycosylase